ncbi:diguanylate cyclase [Acidaminobacter sp. JC074]|uniref:sensor domain-containing diguanylate cyclase n=1 Tax=Acidaminobacter sp. JC074 TaxID=2530199 RepID=UPI001F0D1046|nr:diguanylate cyclase [Acidaminobacter sp. JC074]MCH4886486.1 diguanylate cyclase [Acidaminobacter sp. JC074]
MFQSIRNRAILIYLIIFVIIIGTLTYTFSESTTSEMRSLIIENSKEITRLQAEIISNNLELHISTLEQLASMNSLLNKKIDRFNQTTMKYTDSDKFIFDHIYFIDLEGNSYWQDGTIGNVTDREYFYQIIENNLDYYVSQPYMGRYLKAPAVAILVPVRDSGELIGALAGSIKVESLSKSFENVKLATESYGWIIDRQGTIITHPDFQYENYVNIQDLPKYGYSNEPEVIQSLLKDSSGSGTFESDGENHIMTFTKIPYAGWKLGITSKEDDIYSPTAIIREMVVTRGLLLLLIGLILTTFITYSLLKPIEKLTESAKASLPFKSNLTGLQKNTEMMTLVDTYNSMHSAIEKHTSQLEGLVEKRTEELRVANKKLTKLATRDALTGIYNRHQLYIEINDFIESVKENRINTFSLCFIDINNFKYYNDTFGHDLGDEILIKISGHMASFIRSKDVIGRYGGDEFIILLPHIEEDQLQKLIVRLIQSVEDLIHDQDYLENLLGQEVQIPNDKEISLSIGYARYISSSKYTADDLIKSADGKMYEMKRQIKGK